MISLKNLDEKKFKDIILNKIDYCVIYSVKSEDLVFSEKDINDKNEDKDTIVSFYFLFKYLDDNETSNDERT